jgi:hypothetical protein
MNMVNQDDEQLKILAILHYVWGGLIAFFSCFGFLYVIIGIVALVAGTQSHDGPPAASLFCWVRPSED